MIKNHLWNHYNPVRITAGVGAVNQLPDLAVFADNLLLVTTPGFTQRGMTEKICKLLGRESIEVFDRTTPNPDLDDLDKLTQQYRDEGFTGIIGLGGGSVLDAAKVLGTTLAENRAEPLSNTLRKQDINAEQKNIPVIAIPTTSGTGAEVTSFATVWDNLKEKKHSLTGAHVCPRHAVLDPELTLTLPRNKTLYTGLDAISHALESLWNKNRTPVSEAYAMQALCLANKALPAVLEQPDNTGERALMQEASLLAGLAISQTRTAIAHSISYPVTIHYGVPHGLACSFVLTGLIDRYVATLEGAEERKMLLEIQNMLKSVGLKDEIKGYGIDPGKYIDEMFNPERAGNCSVKIDRDDVYKLLRSSCS